MHSELTHKQKYMKKYNKRYKATHKKEILDYQTEHKEQAKEWQKNYRLTQPDKRRLQKERDFQIHKAERTAWLQKYRTTEKGKAVSCNNHHKRRMLKANSSITTDQLKNLVKSAKYCYWCAQRFTKSIKKHVDHYYPLAKGGEHKMSNLVVTCSFCNLSKSSKDPMVFAQSVGRLL